METLGGTRVGALRPAAHRVPVLHGVLVEDRLPQSLPLLLGDAGHFVVLS